MFIARHDGGREELAECENGKPAAALAHVLPEPHLHIGLLEGFHTAELLRVFRLLFLDDVDDVVDGNHTQQAPLTIHHRQRHEVVVGRDLRHFLLRRVGRYAHHL